MHDKKDWIYNSERCERTKHDMHSTDGTHYGIPVPQEVHAVKGGKYTITVTALLVTFFAVGISFLFQTNCIETKSANLVLLEERMWSSEKTLLTPLWGQHVQHVFRVDFESRPD